VHSFQCNLHIGGTIMGLKLILGEIHKLYRPNQIKYRQLWHIDIYIVLKLFADNTNVFLHRKSLKDTINKENNTLLHLSAWFCANKLSLSFNKTSYTIFGKHANDERNTTVHHRLRGSASTVLTAIGQVNGRWQILTPWRIATPQPIATNDS